MVPGFGVSAKCPVFWAFIPKVWFPYSSFQQVRQPSIPSPVEEDMSKIWYTTAIVFIQRPSIVLPVWRCIMFNGSYIRACRILRFVKKKIDFAFLSLGGPCHGARDWCLSRVPNHRYQWQELSVGAYIELSFIGCGFLIHLSNRSDSPRFWAPWKKIRQKYDIQQEPSLFKGHPLSC